MTDHPTYLHLEGLWDTSMYNNLHGSKAHPKILHFLINLICFVNPNLSANSDEWLHGSMAIKKFMFQDRFYDTNLMGKIHQI